LIALHNSMFIYLCQRRLFYTLNWCKKPWEIDDAFNACDFSVENNDRTWSI